MHLEKEVFVYPTENYYYFEFPAEGKLIAGNIALFANIRDDGKFSFSYFDRARVRDKNSSTQVREYSAKDGILVSKIDDFNYSITFKDKTVIFRLNDVGMVAPKRTTIFNEEVFIGTSFDESGIKFFLVYNNATNSFYWILNEDDFVPEKLINYSEDVFIGERTGFAFYNNKELDRKILFGVKFSNTFNNNWYDGPFDQLPDNYIKTGKIDIMKYIEKAYPNTINNTDIYSHYLINLAKRVAIHPHQDYYTAEELLNVVLQCNSSSSSKNEFYLCITTPKTEVHT